MRSKTLVILAAGLGTRYGGHKQLEAVTSRGETIIDFSLYDALSAGIEKVVFITRRSLADELGTEFSSKLKGRAEIDIVLQDEFPGPGREKPWGTGHAVLAASEAVDERFWMINADDLYGRAAFLALASSEGPYFAMVAYRLGNTLSPNGGVSRGECLVDRDGLLESILERKGIVSENGTIACDDPEARLTADTPVSMNLWEFTPAVFRVLRDRFEQFAEKHGKDPDREFFITEAINDAIRAREAAVRVVRTDERWAGITYREDRSSVALHLESLRDRGLYPERLW